MKKPEENDLLQIKKTDINNDDDLEEFNFILKRSENVVKINHVNNKVKEIDYTYSSNDNYSDEIVYYLTQKIDKINQYKYNKFLNNSNNNFKIFNVNYTTDIDIFYQYELSKREVHYNQKSFNVHEHRKIPYEEENRQLHRRQNPSSNNFYANELQKHIYNNRRNASVDDKNRFFDEEEKNKDKIKIGEIPEFINNNSTINNLHYLNDEKGDDTNRNLDNINIRGHLGNKLRKSFFQ